MEAAFLGIDHAQIAAPPGCEDRARRFFGTLLGLPEVEKPLVLRGRGGVWFRIGPSHELHVGVEREFVPAKKAHSAFRVTGLDALRAHLEAAGETIITDDVLLPGQTGRFFVTDLFGNRLEFVERSCEVSGSATEPEEASA